MRKIYTIVLSTVFLLGAGQTNLADSTKKEIGERVVRTNEQTTAIGDAILKANAAEAKEADAFKKLDSISIVNKKKLR
jgi:hypothetical protein